MRLTLLLVAVLLGRTIVAAESEEERRVWQVATTKGLIAFWDFSLTEDGAWTSYHDEDVAQRGYPVFLRRIGDPQSYRPDQWPYSDEQSKLVFDSSGPFGRAVRFNKGYVFGEVPRSEFDRSPLDIHGHQPFTLIAWVKFIGARHLVAGIWDEGGWDKYGGRRQIALFGGLFGSRGVIGHVSATGAASYPQSTVSGSQYARCRAIDGRAFDNNQWIAMAMTFDPATEQVRVYCDGTATASQITDPVAQDVFRYDEPVSSNPYHFPWPLFSPRTFVLKFNGYNVQTSGVYEHWLLVDTEEGAITYDRSCPASEKVQPAYRVEFSVTRAGKSLLPQPLSLVAAGKTRAALAGGMKIKPGDQVVASLHAPGDDGWRQVGTEIRYRVREGSPFTFGRALGLGTEPIDHGTQLCIDGVAVFNRVLGDKELRELSFATKR